MKPALINFAVLLVALLCAAAQAVEPVPASLLAHGSDQMLWIALTTAGEQPGEPERKTVLRYREAGGDWRDLGVIGAPVIDLASRGDQLLVALENGEWMLVWPGGSASGPIPPSGAHVRALAARDESVWAVALVSGGAAAVGPPSTRPTTRLRAATAPVTLPAGPAKLSLLRFTGSAWTGVADLPFEPDLSVPLALSVAEDLPVVARLRSPDVLETLQLTEDGRWAVSSTRFPFEIADFKLLSDGPLVRLWAAGRGGGGILTSLDPDARLVELKLPDNLTGATDRALTHAIEQFRMVVATDNQLFEVSYDPASLDVLAAKPVLEPPPPGNPIYETGLQLVLLAGIVAMVAGTLGRFEATREAAERMDDRTLAPLLPRLTAFMIDAIPVLAALMFIILRSRDELELARRLSDWPLAAVIAADLLYMCLAELLTGRTLGKWLFGLRVVGLDGNKPPPGAVVLRNFLRLVDVIPPLPLLLLVSKLRQRPGDAAAGTLVVTDAPRPADKALDEDGV